MPYDTILSFQWCYHHSVQFINWENKIKLCIAKQKINMFANKKDNVRLGKLLAKHIDFFGMLTLTKTSSGLDLRKEL
jgi:hypothetical protein